jgi:hypothetical protein
MSTGAGGEGGEGGIQFVAQFDPAMGELPEGLYVDGTTAYVGLATLGAVVKVDLESGAVTPFGSIPKPPMNGGFLLGIALDAEKNVYVGFGGGPGTPVTNGIYKIPAAGGAVTTPWATDTDMNFPNGLTFDAAGNLFVADSGGTVFEIAPDGAVAAWATDLLLSGEGSTCMFAAPVPLGANGAIIVGDAMYVSNTNFGSIVKIPIMPDGSAGAVAAFSGPDCNTLGGIDGIAATPNGGQIVGVVNSQNELVKISLTDGSFIEGDASLLFDNPASISIAMVDGVFRAYVTNSAFFDTAAPQPALLSVPLD